MAQTFLGVPWQHQGRTRDGVDCVGLVYAVYAALGYPTSHVVIPPYRTQPDGTLLSIFDRYMTRIPLKAIGNGSVAVFAFAGSPYHAGIVADVHSSSLIHAFAGKRAVVYDYLDNPTKGREFIRAYDFNGVING